MSGINYFGTGVWLIMKFHAAANGLGVIGGNTVNLVGLGGCIADSMWSVVYSKICPHQTICRLLQRSTQLL